MYYFFVQLLQPFTLAYLLLLVALINLWRKRRETRGRLLFVTAAFAVLTVCALPATAHLALGSLEWGYPPLAARPADADVIVVLGGGVLPARPPRARAELAPDSLRRCVAAAELYRQGTPCKVLVSGGRINDGVPDPAVADLMRDALLSLGVPSHDILVENTSRTTYENAVECSKLMAQNGFRKAVLVTDAIHMSRGMGCFRKQSIEPIPAPCHHRATAFEWDFFDFVPSPHGAGTMQSAAHEWLGILWYRCHGRI